MTNVSDLEGAELDYWVAKAAGHKRVGYKWGYKDDKVMFDDSDGDEGDWCFDYRPSTNWQHGGPLIEREKMVIESLCDNEWRARVCDFTPDGGLIEGNWQVGPTPLIAAMRAYVASKFGDTVDD